MSEKPTTRTLGNQGGNGKATAAIDEASLPGERIYQDEGARAKA